MDFTAIDKVGLELEGAWNVRPPDAAYHADGSVRGVSGAIIGEMVSPPMATFADVSTWITAAYPADSNTSCGFHVHVSFKSRRDYAKLMHPAFFEYFSRRMEEWGRKVNLPAAHPFWYRLSGANFFCSKNFVPDTQAQLRRKSNARYAQLNYCFKFHGTIECRLAPVFKQANIAVSYTKELCSIYEDFLTNEAKADSTYSVTRVDDLV
jgi:hypothetical protein